MQDLSPALTDPELGFTSFSVQRTTYRRQSGSSVPSQQTLSASGCIHPGTPEMLRLLPEEDRHEDFIAVYTDFPLTLGENAGGSTYTTPDRILWNGATWRVVKVRAWSLFCYYQCIAVRVND